MLFLSNLFKKTRISSTSIISLLCHMFVLVLFFILYKHSLEKEDFNSQNKNNNIEVFYFTVVTHSTLGFGDITPRSKECKQLVTAHAFLIIVLVAFFGSN